MGDGARIMVHFSCPHCVTIYQARQERRTADDCSGDFYCERYGSPVHDWTGFYHFSDWVMAVESSPNRRRLS